MNLYLFLSAESQGESLVAVLAMDDRFQQERELGK